MGVDDGALAIGTLIELAYAMLAEKRKIVDDFLQIFAGPHVFPLSDIRPSSHAEGFYRIRFLFAILFRDCFSRLSFISTDAAGTRRTITRPKAV